MVERGIGVEEVQSVVNGGETIEDYPTDTPFPSDVPGVTVEPFDDGEFVGSQFTFESVPLAEFAGTGAEEINISRSGDTYVVTGVLDLSSGQIGRAHV